jgi:hypothetical protein
MKKIIVVCTFFALTSCASIKQYIPSSWDANQAKVATDIKYTASQIDCAGDMNFQLNQLMMDIKWFNIYSVDKGTEDVHVLMQRLETVVKEYQDRASKEKVSPLYCDLKKKIIQQQADIISKTVQGRF